MNESKSLPTLTAADVANYVVCPEAYRLKYLRRGSDKDVQHSEKVKELRNIWVEQQDLSTRLSTYAKTTYLLLVALVIVLFLFEERRLAANTGEQNRPPAMHGD